MNYFGHLYLDKEKDILVNLYLAGEEMHYEIRTPNHKTGNLITNLAKICALPISYDALGLKVIRGILPCYFHPGHKRVYIFRLRDTKVANIYPDGSIEPKAMIPSIAKTLMSQTKEYQLSFQNTVVKTYIFQDCKFTTDLHTHLNANLKPDILIALGIFHQIRYPLYYIKKLGLRLSPSQEQRLSLMREEVARTIHEPDLKGKYLDRRIDDNTFLNFADLILNNLGNASYNLPLIRASLSILKDGQAVFTNLEKVYLYRYVFTRGTEDASPIAFHDVHLIPDEDIVACLRQMFLDLKHPVYRNNTLYQNKLLWTARSYQENGICYVEISDTNLIKPGTAIQVLKEIHAVMPAIYEETQVRIRFLAAFRRIPLTIVKNAPSTVSIQENLRVLDSIMPDPYVAGCDIVGEEMNDIRELRAEIRAMTKLARKDESFVLRIHAGENDSLKDNVMNSIACVKEALEPGQAMPKIRIGHGLYTANLKSRKGQRLLEELRECRAVLEFQITSNVRLNNLSSIRFHPLKEYLSAGILCVQGTDGGALYGTDSVDEQLALQRMLDLSPEELKKMCRAEQLVWEYSEEAFQRKLGAMKNRSIEEISTERLRNNLHDFDWLNEGSPKLPTEELLSGRIQPLPVGKLPIVLCGGSYNNDMHSTRLQDADCRLIDELLAVVNPEKHYFVIGNRLKGYERYLLDKNQGRCEVYAFLPSVMEEKEAKSLLRSHDGLHFRISTELEPMGIYKSVAYEIFKQRKSILLAFDGNSAAANLIQEANNSKYECRIFIDERRKMLRQKAESLQGYITLFRDAEILAEIKKHL